MTGNKGQRSIANARHGLALLMVVMLVAVVSVLAVTTVVTSSLNAKVSRNYADMARAGDLARSGLVHGQYIIERDHMDAVGVTHGPFQIDEEAEGSYSISLVWLDESQRLARMSVTGAVGGTRNTCSKDVTVCQSYPVLVMSLNPKGYWRLGDLANPAVDETGSNPGTYTAWVVLGQPGAIAYDSDTAAEFDGIDDYVAAGSLDVSGYSALTITAWIYPAPYDVEDDEDREIFTWKGKTGFEFKVKVDGDEAKLSVDALLTGKSKKAEAQVEQFLGQWSFVAATWDGDRLRLYRNGSEISAKDVTGEFITTPDTQMFIGAKAGKRFRKEWKGKLDEVAVFDQALTPEQIQELHEVGTGQ